MLVVTNVRRASAEYGGGGALAGSAYIRPRRSSTLLSFILCLVALDIIYYKEYNKDAEEDDNVDDDIGVA